jgi:hypothetical protein
VAPVADTSNVHRAWAVLVFLVVLLLQDTHRAATLRTIIKDMQQTAAAALVDIFQGTEDQMADPE